jgi:CRISPR-associated protein Csx10
MKTLTITLKLLDDTVISERAATQGGHRCLDYIPGANLLGWSATQLYPTLSKHDAWSLFHSGMVRFGNALPLTATGAVGRPMPLCWHENKGGNRAIQDSQIQPGSLMNLLHCEPDADVQPRQLRAGYVSEQGEVVKPNRMLRMKTAIDPDQGRAANAQLFGYEAIVAGTRFQAKLTADDTIDPSLLEKLRTSLCGQIRLGRSRSAQYGGVQALTNSWREETPTNKPQSNLILWLQSDLALVNEAGSPTLVPEAQLLGLTSGARYQADRSFVRYRRYTPYNQARRSHDVERQVISQGSVLCYALDTLNYFDPALFTDLPEKNSKPTVTH